MHETPETTQTMYELTPLASGRCIVCDVIYISVLQHTSFREGFINEIDLPIGDKLNRLGKEMTVYSRNKDFTLSFGSPIKMSRTLGTFHLRR